MFRTKLTLAGLMVAVAFLGLSSTRALAAHDAWYGYAVSLSKSQQTAPFITDTLAPGGSPTQSQQPVRFITDTLAPGGGPATVSLSASRGFDWRDSGIGALVMGGVAVALLASRRVLQRRRVVAA
jgi:hypothetical protein